MIASENYTFQVRMSIKQIEQKTLGIVPRHLFIFMADSLANAV